jgi:hypothetical protein
MHVWLDGDIVVFRAGFAAEKTAYYLTGSDGKPRRFQYKKEAESYMQTHMIDPATLESCREVEPLENALHTIKLMMYSMMETLQVSRDEITVCLSGDDNFRYHVAKTKPYKGNRDTAHRPTHEKAIREYLQTRYKSAVSDGEEADDYIGINHYRLWLQDPEASVIASLDKDLNMVPGLHYNFAKNLAYYVDPEEADKTFWRQLLTGDSTDNIQGIPGMGPAGAAKVLANGGPSDWPRLVAETYKKHYGDDWRTVMTEMGRLLWIRREPDQWWEVPDSC